MRISRPAPFYVDLGDIGDREVVPCIICCMYPVIKSISEITILSFLFHISSKNCVKIVWIFL